MPGTVSTMRSAFFDQSYSSGSVSKLHLCLIIQVRGRGYGGAPSLASSLSAFGLRSYQTLREWAQSALGNLGETDASASECLEQ